MRGVLLAAGGLAIIAAGCVACNASRRSAHAPPHLQVPDEILVRLSVPASHRESETALLAGLEHLFGPPRDVCCPSDPRLTYRFGIGDRSVEQAVREARALDPDRVWAQPNFIYTPDKQPNDPEFKLQWSLDDAGDADIDAPEAWDVVIGDPRVAVAIVDSGVWYKNPDLDGRVWKNDVECTGSPGVDDDGNGYIDDCYGIDAPHAVSGGAPGPVPAGDPNAVGNDHGTAVAGIAAAASDNAKLMAGVVWDGRIMICKFFEGPFDGTTFDLEKCLRYVLQAKRAPGKGLDHLVAVNMSWTTSQYDDLVYCDIDGLRHEGVLAVASAGNLGTDNDWQAHYPASYFLPNVVAVAEMTRKQTLANGSNWGARSVHTAAPGAVSSLGLGDKVKAFSGTSAAAPHVTGLLALLEAKVLQDGRTDLDWRGLKNLVLAGGKPLAGGDQKLISRRRIRAWDPEPTGAAPDSGDTAPRMGSLTCRDQVVQRRLRPLENHLESGKKELLVAPGTSIFLAAISIDCAAPGGPVEAVAVDSTGSTISIPLDDGDLGHDQVDGDGVFTAVWTPPADLTDFVLKYRYGASATEIADDAVAVRVVTNAPPGEAQQTLACTPPVDGVQQ